MKISVFYDHILQAAEQTGKALEELLQGVRNSGIEAVEINMSYLCEHEETYSLLKEANLHISCVYEFYEMDYKDEKEKAKKHIDTALKAGAEKILVVPGFLSEDEARLMKDCVSDYERTAEFFDKNEKVQSMARGLADIVKLGTEAGVTVTVEDFDDAKSPLSSVNGLLWFFKHIPQLKCTFDTGNFIINGEDVMMALEMLKERIVHVHCKDRGEESVAVGDGYIPINIVINKIKESGYDGYLAIEHFDAHDQEMCMKRSAEYLVRN